LAASFLSTVGCLSVFIGPLVGLGSLVGIVCGHLARRHMKEQPGLGGANIALAGLVVGYVFLVIYSLFWACLVWNIRLSST
jgi:hypothetical protein